MFFAGEAEYVAFADECSCDGPVESWLQNVVDAMRAALSHEFKVAIPAYDEKPRTKWIFDYSVQNTIMVSRTFFTQDVNEAFEELEEGNEDALKARSEAQVCCSSSCLEWQLSNVHTPSCDTYMCYSRCLILCCEDPQTFLEAWQQRCLCCYRASLISRWLS